MSTSGAAGPVAASRTIYAPRLNVGQTRWATASADDESELKVYVSFSGAALEGFGSGWLGGCIVDIDGFSLESAVEEAGRHGLVPAVPFEAISVALDEGEERKVPSEYVNVALQKSDVDALDWLLGGVGQGIDPFA